jgi:RNA recognition motif-containing protein
MGRMLQVGNLSASTTDDELSLKFGEYGVVESATVIRDLHTGMSKRMGRVVMANREEAQAAINWLHLSQLNGRTISVTRVVMH